MADAEGAIRPADKQDLEAVLETLNITNKAFFEAIVTADVFRDPYLAVDELEREFERKAFTVYEVQGRIVGVAAFEARRLGVGVVDRVYVLPGFQRKGIGAALLAHIEGCAKAQGIREIVLWTDPKAVWAIAFYKRLDYSDIEPDAYYDDPMIDERVRQHGTELAVLRKALFVDRMAEPL